MTATEECIMAQVRYIVNDVDSAVAFYTSKLGFTLEQQFGPAMAILQKDDLRLWVAGPKASASRPMPDGATPTPGGWARFVLTVDDLASLVSQLKDDGVQLRNEIVEGPGGKQILCMDPAGNVVELFEPA
jgi:predicted enzyme related to lactoylglutathione lyase